jgi:protein tyrosine/serine phosphatase
VTRSEEATGNKTEVPEAQALAGERWIELAGVVNLRDAGGLMTSDGRTVAHGRLLRSANLQRATPADISVLTNDLGLTDVIDLRSDFELDREGPGPLTRIPGVRQHHLSLLPEDVLPDAPPRNRDGDELLPWQTDALREREAKGQEWSYLGYLSDRPDSILSAMRVIGSAKGAVLVHCAAGKDRTGVVTALALEVAGVPREAVIADYLLSNDRLDHVNDALLSTPTYAHSLRGRDRSTLLVVADTVRRVLESLDPAGGAAGWLSAAGLTKDELQAIRVKLGVA